MVKRSNAATPAKAGASNLAKSALTSTQSQKSSILKHAFAPSRFQLNLFASVVQGLRTQVLRIHDTLSGRQSSNYELEAGRVSCLQWGLYHGEKGKDDRPSKKRKTKTGTADAQQGNAVIAIGYANEPRIDLYSPLEGKIVSSLTNGHSKGIRDFRFSSSSERKAWSLGGDGKLVEWNLDNGEVIRATDLPTPLSSSNLLYEISDVIFTASTSIYTLDADSINAADFDTLSGFSSQIHSLIVDFDNGKSTAILGASENERNAVVLEVETGKIRGNLVAETAIESVALPDESSFDKLLLAVVTERGAVEIFESPFKFEQASGKKSLKEANKAKTKRAVSKLQILRPDSSEAVAIMAISFDGQDLIVCWAEGGANPFFHRLPCRDASGKLLSSIKGDIQIEKSKAQSGIANAKMNGRNSAAQVDDTHAVIVRGKEGEDEMALDNNEEIEASSDEEEEADEDDDDDDETEQTAPLINGAHESDDDMADAGNAGDEEDDEDAEPTFGDKAKALAMAKPTQLIDVASAFPTAQTDLVPQSGKALSLPSGMSLGTVLAQALRTNDRELLETCFHVQELQVVRATIERLDSTLAGALLERLAERFHNRPGRAGSLQVWIQWTLVAHGGYLAGQRQSKIVNQLRDLHDVVRERAQALQPLLLLKGKLDMLEAQMRMRKDVVQRSRALQAAREEEEEDAIYVEGQEDESSDEEGNIKSRTIAGADPEDIDFDSDEEDDGDMPTTMDVDDEEEDDEDGDGSGEGGLIDDEAEETDDDSGLDDGIDHDDVDTADEFDSESELEEPVRKAKSRPKVNGELRKG